MHTANQLQAGHASTTPCRVPQLQPMQRAKGQARPPTLQHGAQLAASTAAAEVATSTAGYAPSTSEQFSELTSEYIPTKRPSYAKPSVCDTGTLRPSAEWYPSWMQYRRREDNYVFWQDKFSRNSLDISYEERRWTVFSTIWYLLRQTRFHAVPASIRYLIFLGWRAVMMRAYEAHKSLVLWQCKLDAWLAARAVASRQPPASSFQAESASSQQGPQEPSSSSSSTVTEQETAPGPGFSRVMALRRLHWKNCLIGEVMYSVNVYKTGRIHMLPPKKKPLERPTWFWLF